MRNNKKFSLRTVTAIVLCGVMAVAPLSANAAAPVLDAKADTAAIDEENNSSWMSLDADEIGFTLSSSDPSPSTYLNVEDCLYGYDYLTWSSSNNYVATVDSRGKVTARHEGTAVITCTTNFGEWASCNINVYKDSSYGQKVEKPALNKTSLTMTLHYYDRTPQTQLYLVSNSLLRRVTAWVSSNPSVAQVSSNGIVTGMSAGTAVISAYTNAGDYLSCTVYVSSDIGTATISESAVALHNIGETKQLSARIQVEGGDTVPFTWTSSNPAVATVTSNGLVTAVGDGQATITATAPDGKTVACYVYTGSAASQYESDEALAAALALAGIIAIAGVSAAAS